VETDAKPAGTGTVGAVVRPVIITEEMMRLACTDDLWHYAQNLNAMMRYGYCNKCGLTPNGCEREGCRTLQPNLPSKHELRGLNTL